MMPRPADGALDGEVFAAAQAGDVEALVAIDAASQKPWTADAFLAELKSYPPTVFVLRASEILAFVVTRVQGPEMDIVNLAVSAHRRRCGFGRRILRRVLDLAASSGVRTVFLEVRERNHEAWALYVSAGFKQTQRRRGFYQDPPDDAILMRLEIG